MIKFVQCVRRKPGLSKQEFREEWMRYGELVKEIAGASQAARCQSGERPGENRPAPEIGIPDPANPRALLGLIRQDWPGRAL